MSGLSHTLNIASSAIGAQQYGLSITGHNIANVNTPEYSRQNVPLAAYKPILAGGFLIGNGVDVEQIENTVDKYLEKRLIGQKSELSASDAFVSYTNILEGVFSENSEGSLSKLMPDYWNAWYALSDNPEGSAEREVVVENGIKIAEKFDSLDSTLQDLQLDITREIDATLREINKISAQIADVNNEIMSLEGQRTANDQRDYRGALITNLAKLTDVQTFEQANGAVSVNTGGFLLVAGIDSYNLSMQEGQVMWEGSNGGMHNITDKITEGAVGGRLNMRDEMIPATRAELDELARDFIWSVNYQHSQGSGTSYFDSPLEGTVKADETGLLSTMAFGNKIDYSKDFKMWIKDDTTFVPEYRSVSVDMAKGTAKAIDWVGSEPSGATARYDFTVLRGGMTGKEVILTDGLGLGSVQTGDSISLALNGSIADQTLTIIDKDGTVNTIEINDVEGNTKRSSVSIAEKLNSMDNIEAYVSENVVDLDISNLMPAVANAHENDNVKFEFISGEVSESISFLIGADVATTRDNFRAALNNVINNTNDLSVIYDTDETATITSAAGENISIGNFDVQDNATITINAFTQDATGAGEASFEIGGVNVTFTLDTSGGAAGAAQLLKEGLDASSTELAAEGISWALNGAGTGVIITSSDQKNLDIANIKSHVGNANGGFTVTGAVGTTVATGVLAEGVVTGTTVAPDVVETSTILMDGATLTESGGAGTDSGVKNGVITMFLAPDTTIHSNIAAADGSIFNKAKNVFADSGNSIITLGGDDGFDNFDNGDTISFNLVEADGTINAISYTVVDPPVAPLDSNAKQLEAALLSIVPFVNPPVLDPEIYSIVRVGEAVSIIKKDGTAIEITGFNDTGGDAQLKTITGSHSDGANPVEYILSSGVNTEVKSSPYDLSGVIEWKKYDEQGKYQYENGTGIINLDDAGPYTFDNSATASGITFDFSPGTLVAGNTFSINTGSTGEVDSLDLTTRGFANSISDIYKFKVKEPGGKLGTDDITIEWSNSVTYGSFKLDSSDPPFTPVYETVDGMRLQFNDGTLFSNDVFVIETNENGVPDAELASDMHWTMESFKDQFNRRSNGINAIITHDNTLKFSADTNSYDIKDMGCSGLDGFCEVNTKIVVNDYTVFTQDVEDFQIIRNNAGDWSFNNDYTNGIATMIPAGGSDAGFGIDLTGNGITDLTVVFDTPVTGEGTIEFDIFKRDAGSNSFAFSGGNNNDSGLTAAMGINTFFQGEDSLSIGINHVLDETWFVAGTKIDESTGEIATGDNSNALAITDLQYKTTEMKQWTFDRGKNPVSKTMTTSLTDYYSVMIGSIGVTAQGELRTQAYNKMMVMQMGEQRDSISAVSLDEEMVSLMKYQHAFTAASKLLTVTDEMLNTIVSMR